MAAPTRARGHIPSALPKKRPRPRRAALAWTSLALPVVAVVCFISVHVFAGSSSQTSSGLVNVLDGRPYAMAAEPGELTLLSFLATQPDTADSPSRNQAVALVSLSAQYRAEGVSVAIVDDSPVPASTNALTNTVYDWQLGTVAMLEDAGHRAADRYGIATTPTTLLVSSTGTVLARWTGYVLTSAAAVVITAHLSQAPQS